ncbi:MAG: class I SAM-dependent methyltransferase [Halodesulfurarchaeum sp.]
MTGAEEPADSPPIRAVYDRIGTHFSKTRRYPWPAVESFLEGRGGRLGIDVGCGNGRHLRPLREVLERAIGVDLSRTLLREARDGLSGLNRVDLLEGTATAIPIGDDRVDVGLYVAAIHHLRTREGRIESLDELARVLDPAGIALLSAWSITHDRFDREEGFDTTVDWTLPDGQTVPRFYHIYDLEEFRGDLDASRLAPEAVWTEAGNCYARVRPGRR